MNAPSDSFSKEWWSEFLSRPITLAPEPILKAYGDLLTYALAFIRNKAIAPEGIDPQELHDLADSLHNIPAILFDYGRWIDDAAYRNRYLRPFDEKWKNETFGLQEYVRQRLEMYEGGN
jgi:hypothetical protein